MACHGMAVHGRPVPGTVQDEEHFVMRCLHNEPVRHRYAGFFTTSTDRSMRSLLANNDRREVAHFIWDLLEHNRMA